MKPLYVKNTVLIFSTPSYRPFSLKIGIHTLLFPFFGYKMLMIL